MDKLDCPDIGNIDYVKQDFVLLWQEIIRRGQPTEVDPDGLQSAQIQSIRCKRPT